MGLRFPGLAPHHALPFMPVHRAGDERVKTLPVPGYRQARNYTCGYATALMVVRYFKPDTPARELFDRLGTSRDGTRQSAIVRELRRSGVRANIRYDVHFGRLRREIDLGKPIVGYLNDLEHWVVIYGYGIGPDRVFVADPEPNERCEHLWSRYGRRLGRFGIICSAREPVLVRPSAGPHRGPILLPPSTMAARAPSAGDAPDAADSEPPQLTLPFRRGID